MPEENPDPMPDHEYRHEAEAPPEKEGKSKKMADGRRPRGWLENDVKQVCDRFVTGEIVLAEGQFLTPHRTGRLVKELDGLDEAPSTGAVAAVFDRWEAVGFAVFRKEPRAFEDYTEDGKTRGLAALKAERSEKKKQEREAAKQAETGLT